MGVDKCIYATTDNEVRAAIIGMLGRKFGVPYTGDYGCSLLKIDQDEIWDGTKGITDQVEITISELANMPDYVKPHKVKEMTVAEISEKLGHEVKIIK